MGSTPKQLPDSGPVTWSTVPGGTMAMSRTQPSKWPISTLLILKAQPVGLDQRIVKSGPVNYLE